MASTVKGLPCSAPFCPHAMFRPKNEGMSANEVELVAKVYARNSAWGHWEPTQRLGSLGAHTALGVTGAHTALGVTGGPHSVWGHWGPKAYSGSEVSSGWMT